MTKRQNLEDQIHRSIIAYLRMVLPDAIISHAANEGVRGGRAGVLDGSRRRAMGVLAGYPDITIHHGGVTMLLEVKSAKGTLTRAQKAVRDNLVRQRIPYGVVRSIDDVRAFLILWGVGFIEKVELRGQVT